MNWVRGLLVGRSGVDQLNLALVFFYFGMNMVFYVDGMGMLHYLSYVPVLFCIFRMFSRNIERRSRENRRFISILIPVKSWIFRFPKWFNGAAIRHRDRKTHRFYKCPSCSKYVRVPRGKGKICIICPLCSEEFIKTT